jgi:uncharacterized membrane protein
LIVKGFAATMDRHPMEDIMSDATPATAVPPPATGVREDRIMPAVVYGLYLVGVGHFTVLIGLLIAYACRGSAGPVAASHYTYQVRTFWLSIWWFVVGVILCIVGGILSIILIGIPILGLGIAICSGVWLYVVVRALIGLVYLAQGEPHPRPDGWLI